MITPTYEGATSVAVRNAVNALGISYEAAAKRVGVSRATLSKLLSGRPISATMLQKLLKGLPADHGKQVLIGHLIDEMRRIGASPEGITIRETTRHSYLLEKLSELLAADSSRALDVVRLIESWQAPSSTPHPESIQQQPSRMLSD